jgi:hypothetical protein
MSIKVLINVFINHPISSIRVLLQQQDALGE